MKYSVYGKFDIEVIRNGDVWHVFRIGQGIKRPEPNVHIPSNASDAEIRVALDDAFHELAASGKSIKEIK